MCVFNVDGRLYSTHHKLMLENGQDVSTGARAPEAKILKLLGDIIIMIVWIICSTLKLIATSATHIMRCTCLFDKPPLSDLVKKVGRQNHADIYLSMANVMTVVVCPAG